MVDAVWNPTLLPVQDGRVEIPVLHVPWMGTVLVNVDSTDTIDAVKRAIANMTMVNDHPVTRPWILGFFLIMFWFFLLNFFLFPQYSPATGAEGRPAPHCHPQFGVGTAFEPPQYAVEHANRRVGGGGSATCVFLAFMDRKLPAIRSRGPHAISCSWWDPATSNCNDSP